MQADEMMRRGRAPRAFTAGQASDRQLTRAQRLLFVFALVTFGCASGYTTLALLTQVTPALFPGQSLNVPGLQGLVESLPGPAKIAPPSTSSVFNRRINLVVMGVDRRPGGSEVETRTDSLMVATIDPTSKQATVIGIPRDLWVDIHPPQGGVYQDRINASFEVGAAAGKSVEAGAKQLEKDIKANFGIEIDYYLWLDIPAVEKLVDAIDGIDLDIPPDLTVPSWWYTDDDRTNPHWVSFGAGLQHLNGYNAVAFGRYRDDSDFRRIKRQQAVMQAALTKALSNGLLNNPLDLWDAYGSLVRTDIPKGKMPGYALLLKDAAASLTEVSLGDPVNGVDTVVGFTTDGGAAVLRWNPENVQYWLSQAFTKGRYAGVTVEITNASGDDGSPRAFAFGRYLKYSKGLSRVEVGADEAARMDTVITVYSEDKRPVAEDIAKWIGLPDTAIRMAPRTVETEPDVQVVIGQDFSLPAS